MDALVDELMTALAKLHDGERLVLGIVGCPGAGKSTMATALVEAVNDKFGSGIAIVVPMDGYHLSNEILLERGLLPLKGIPDTFDSCGFVELLSQLKSRCIDTLYAPKFDRSIEASIPNAIVIAPQHKLCVVEGNYLLLRTPSWAPVREHLDMVWFVDVDLQVLKARLQQRHENGGKTSVEAEKKVLSTDLPNAEIVLATKIFADKIVSNWEA